MEKIEMVVIQEGKARGLDRLGNRVLTIDDEPDPVDAKIQGDKITVTYKNGRSKLYDFRGNILRTL